MNKHILTVALVLAVFGFVYLGMALYEQAGETAENPVVYDVPSHEEAELTAFRFMKDVVALAPPSRDAAAGARVYGALSEAAKHRIGVETVAQDIPAFLGIQDVPDLGVSVEDLQVTGDETAVVVLGLNYSGGRTVRGIALVVEEGVWKVDQVLLPEQLEGYAGKYDEEPTAGTAAVPDEPEPTVPGGPTLPELTPPGMRDLSDGSCYVGGCSGQVCSDAPDDAGMVTTCEWQESYACYADATCERQQDGVCGWTMTEALRMCLQQTDAR